MANFNFNKVMLGGRMAADPELKQTQSGLPVTSFRVAVNRQKSKDGENAADFINVTAWRETADFVCRYFGKGSSIFIEGALNVRTWTDKDGSKRSATEVVASRVCFVDSKSDAQPASAYLPESYAAPKMEELGDDEDFPF